MLDRLYYAGLTLIDNSQLPNQPEYNCGEGRAKCPDGLRCINEGFMCDNRYQYKGCPDDLDEDEAFCKGELVRMSASNT